MKQVELLFRRMYVSDVMHGAALVLKQEMRVDKAAHLLLTRRLGAAAVADSSGQCVGVLSVVDILRWSLDGRPSGLTRLEATACVWSDWQLVDVTSMERNDVAHYMTRDPLFVAPDTRLVKIAKILVDPNGRPVVVVDEARRPLGLLSSKDLLAALVFAERQPKKGSWAPRQAFSSRA